MGDEQKVNTSPALNLIAIAIAVLIVLSIVILAQPSRFRINPHHKLDGRLPAEALCESLRYLEVPCPPAIEVDVVGFRAGREELFAKMHMHIDTLESLIDQAHCERIHSLPTYINGSDPSGIESWWQPRDVVDPWVYECSFVSRPGEGAIVVDHSDDQMVVVYVYGSTP